MRYALQPSADCARFTFPSFANLSSCWIQVGPTAELLKGNYTRENVTLDGLGSTYRLGRNEIKTLHDDHATRRWENGEMTETTWAETWLDSVANGQSKMSQRSLNSIERHGGGIDAVAAMAKTKGVHLVLLTDDKGAKLVAASVHPFRVLT